MEDPRIVERVRSLVKEGTELKDKLKSASFYGISSSETQNIISNNRRHYQEGEKWKMSVISLLILRFGKDSLYYKQFEEGINTKHKSGGRYCKENVSRALGIVETVLGDIESGLTEDLFYEKEVILFGDLLEQAEEFLKKGFDLAAAIYGRVVLETVVKEFASKKNIKEGSFEETIVALKKAGIIGQPLEHSLRANYSIGSTATHNKEDFTKITKGEIKSFLTFIRDKVLTM